MALCFLNLGSDMLNWNFGVRLCMFLLVASVAFYTYITFLPLWSFLLLMNRIYFLILQIALEAWGLRRQSLGGRQTDIVPGSRFISVPDPFHVMLLQ